MSVELVYLEWRSTLMWEEQSKRKYHSLVLYMENYRREAWHLPKFDEGADEWWVGNGKKSAVLMSCMNWEAT